MKHKIRLLPLLLFAAPILAGFSSPNVQKDQSKDSPWWGWAVLIVIILLIVLWIMWVLSKKEKPEAEEVSAERAEEIPQAPAPEPAPAESKFDDLKVIEGIGPKIEQLLYEAGIRTFRDLASADVSTLEAVLEKAGPRFRLADPSTWPKQAALAAEGKWDELKELQDSLKGGREV